MLFKNLHIWIDDPTTGHTIGKFVSCMMYYDETDLNVIEEYFKKKYPTALLWWSNPMDDVREADCRHNLIVQAMKDGTHIEYAKSTLKKMGSSETLFDYVNKEWNK